MKQRTVILLAGGIFLLSIGYIALPLAFEKWLRTPEQEYRGYFSSVSSTERESGFAPVQLWWEAPPDQKDYRRAKKAARLLLIEGEALVGDVLLPKEKIREYLDAKVQRGEIDYVIVFPTKKTKWGEIFPVLDECRKSRIRIVLLNQYEG